jgi:hypothetical protein
MGFIEKALMATANRKLKDVGELRELHINREEKSCSGLLLLVGERDPIDITIGQYELVKNGDKVTLQLRDVTCSKEWMDKLAGRLVPQMNIDLPPAVASLLKFARVV